MLLRAGSLWVFRWWAVVTCVWVGVWGPVQADWPTLRGDVSRGGNVDFVLRPPYYLAWAMEIEGERLGTAMEPIVQGDRVFVATHAGNLYALDAATGEAQWRVAAHAPFLQSPSVACIKAR